MNTCNKGIAGEIVEVRKSEKELCTDWRIPRFLDLHCGGYDIYESPRFGFCDAEWYLRVWPNACSFGQVSLTLHRDDTGLSSRTVTVSLGLRGSGGGVEWRKKEQELELKKGDYCPLSCISKRTDLRRQKDRLMPGGTITIVCQMKVPGTTDTVGESFSEDYPIGTYTRAREPNTRTYKCQSLDKQDACTQTEAEFKEGRVDDKQSSEKRGIEKVAEDMGKLLDSSKRCDVTVQVQETEFRVHSSILCARSPVLSAMLEHDTAERASNRITIDDCEPDVFGEYLRYLYTGSVRSLCRRTVFGLYRVADQYLADDLKLLCLEHIQNTLCVQTFCDTVTLAVTHEESDLLQLAVDFATHNFSSIVISVEWQNFMSEYPREANEILVKCFGPRGDK